MTPDTEPGSYRNGRSVPIAVALLTLGLLVWAGFQTAQLVQERTALRAALASQGTALQQSTKLRAQLETIMKRTLALAQQGNPGASTIIEQLAKRGITVSAAPSGTTPK